ncbi:MAG: hypothetical protein HZA93_23760 [Verrucomicrobia bacterium]|nr:hypothetical protein [Verrucomicrobiota bacterium]
MIVAGIFLALAAFVALVAAPSHRTLADEERQLREYFKRRDSGLPW